MAIDFHLLEISSYKCNECVVVILAHICRDLVERPLNFDLGGELALFYQQIDSIAVSKTNLMVRRAGNKVSPPEDRFP